MPPRQLQQEESWNSLHRSEASGDVSNDDYAYSEDASMGDEDSQEERSDRSATASPTMPTMRDVRRALHPLQATADRVGRQVEQFAENLDRLTQKRAQFPAKRPKDCRDVLPYVHAYKCIASNTVEHLRAIHAPERQRQLARQTKKKLRDRSSRSSPRHDSMAAKNGDNLRLTSTSDLKRWEQEEQTWELLGAILQIEYPAPQSEGIQYEGTTLARPRKKDSLHSYSSEKEVWDNLLATDDLAWERHTVVEWLKQNAEKSGQDIEQAVEQLESDADRGSGIVAGSWLYTREAIKGQKRLRSWPRAFEPDDPGLETSLMTADKSHSLVTQLDPDAVTRQARALERQDVYFERAMWLACWEIIRRGKSWQYVKKWCNERVEDWRAASMYGELQLQASEATNWQSRFLWRKSCALAARDGGLDEYESAVYGALGGYLPSVQQVSRSWDDHLFAHYNSYLIHSFERYVKHNFASRVPPALTNNDGAFSSPSFAGQRALSGNQLVEKLKLSDETKQEAAEPFKMLQSSLVARNFDDYVFKHGVKLAIVANAERRSKVLNPMPSDLIDGSITGCLSMQDYDLFRVVTHMVFIYQELGHDFGDGNRASAMENFVVAYVDFIGSAGKQQLLPLYASRLSHQRSIECLGRQLPMIHQHNERVTMMSLMGQCGIDIPGVLHMQLQKILQDIPTDPPDKARFPNLTILERGKVNSQVRPIADGFIGEEVTDEQIDLIHGYEWYMLLEGYWQQTLAVGVTLYKFLLRSHALSAARLLSQRVSFSNVSLSKTFAILGKSVDISREIYCDDGRNGLPSPVKKTKSGRKQNHQRQASLSTKSVGDDERDILLGQAATFRDFENLFAALSAMEEWRGLAEPLNRASQ